MHVVNWEWRCELWWSEKEGGVGGVDNMVKEEICENMVMPAE